jgi:transcriptional regulator with XRE-family HTH domain
MTYKEQAKEITRKYLVERTMEQFALGLGLQGMSRQTVWNWKSGQNAPSWETLVKVRTSDAAEPWAKEWADECLAAMVSKPNGDVTVEAAESVGDLIS